MFTTGTVENIAEAREREMRALESQLKSSVRLQMEKIRNGLQALTLSQDRLQEVGDALGRVTDLCRRSETLIENFPFIRQVSRTHQNFVQTRRVYDEFCALDAKVERCATLLEADQERGEPHNLLLVYHHLWRLEAFRRQTLELMADAPSTALYTVKRYFKKLDDLRQAFDGFYWRDVARRVFEYAEGGQATFLVSMAKVLWAMDATERPRFQAILDELISAKFRQAVANSGTSPVEDLSTVLEQLGFWRDDLLLVRNELVPRFPPDYNLLDFAVLTYHRNLHAVISQGISIAPRRATTTTANSNAKSSSLGPADILYIIGWVRTYHDELAAQLGISADDLEPRLLDDREAELVATYVNLSRTKLTEWIGNLHAAEARIFTVRSAPPETDAEERYSSPAARDLFQIVKQHIDTVSTASRGRLLLEIVGEGARALQTFIAAMGKTLEAERNRMLSAQANNTETTGGTEGPPPYFEDYTIMLGNVCLKWVSYVDDLTAVVEGLIVSEFAASSSKSLKGVADAWVNLAKSCTQVLVEIIFKSLRPAMAALFTAEWDGNSVDNDDADAEGSGDASSSRLMGSILATFDDYFHDYQQHADTFLFNKLVADVLERLLLSLLEQLRAKGTKLRMPRAAILLHADAMAILSFFSTYRDEERVRRAVDPFIRLISLIGAPVRLLFLETVAVRKLYPDLPIGFLEEVLGRRTDLDKSSLKEVIESCRKKVLEGDVAGGPTGVASIFAKISHK